MAIELQGVTKVVGGDTHIHETSIRMEEGRFNILLGTTLAGKTTLLRLMAGLERPSSGRVLFKGRDVTGVPVQKRNVAMVYQQFINYPNFSVYDNIASPLRVARTPRREIERRVGEVAELLRITPVLRRLPAELSGGQQQRTALARALVKETDLVLLDEPLANLDYKLREELREELPRLFQRSGTTVVYATTEPTEALLLAGYTATLYQGRITQFGPTAQVYRQPVDLVSARVFSDPPINTARIHKRGDRFHYDDSVHWPVPARLAGLADGPYILGFRPHHITLTRHNDQGIPVRGRVVVTEISGSESVIHMQIGDDTWVSLSHGVHPMQYGAEVELFLQTDHCYYFDRDQRLI